MGRSGWFIAGVLTGAGMMFSSLTYHFLYTKDGLKAVPKTTASLSETYLDVREFTAADWAEHKTVMAAVIQADESELLESAAVNSLRDGFDHWASRFGVEATK